MLINVMLIEKNMYLSGELNTRGTIYVYIEIEL